MIGEWEDMGLQWDLGNGIWGVRYGDWGHGDASVRRGQGALLPRATDIHDSFLCRRQLHDGEGYIMSSTGDGENIE